MKKYRVIAKTGTALITLLVIALLTLLPFTSNISLASEKSLGALSAVYSKGERQAPLGTISVPNDSIPFVSEKSIRNRAADDGLFDAVPVCPESFEIRALLTAHPTLSHSNTEQVLCGLCDPKTVQKRE